MITTDREDRIITWSPAAQKLLGYTSDQVLGQRFFEAVNARDAFGNRFCCRGCGLHEMVRTGEPVRTFEMQATNAAGGVVRTFVSVAPEGGHRNGGVLIYHLRADLRRQADRRRTTDRRSIRPLVRGIAEDGGSTAVAHWWGLSPREIQVLRGLAGGGDTGDIASELGISEATVRNHVQHLLRKLGVHGRVEAITLAYRHQLL
jgi:PAS domain S-box-containing protein